MAYSHDRIWDMRQGKQAAAMEQDDEALSCAIALQTGLLAVGVGCVIKPGCFDDARLLAFRFHRH